MRNGQGFILSSLLLVTWAAPGLGAAESAPASGERKTPPAATRPAPSFTLNLAAAMADPPTWGAGHAAQLAAMERLSEEVEPPLDRAAAHLAIANWLLAVPTSHAATRWLVGLADDEDLALLADSAASARRHVEKARKELEAVGKLTSRPEDGLNDRASRLATTAASLEPFATLLAAGRMTETDEKARQGAWGRVARGLAAARESTDEDLAAGALLWQAFAWQMAGRTERAKSGLPEPLTPPSKPGYDFLARLLRCRLLSDAGQFTAATTLTIEIRRQCSAWFKGDPSNAAAPPQRLAALVQCQIGKRWLQRLRTDPAPAATGPLETMLGELQAAYFDEAEGRPRVYFLETTIPVTIHPPAQKAPATASQPLPADES
ncbi:MAG TPA: hypothetical protein PKY77_25335 [Phycisphaerae bacterium]|nr:hypothetical protein [Phycisphaerae bacterium]HRY66775.1 hypothetical protein [Phycisphaerae bacterium]HSA28415.1 hypothetical protein [Phycisphaerae bacterium]